MTWTQMQLAVYDILKASHGKDVPIIKLYYVLYGEYSPSDDGGSHFRRTQQRVAAHISRINHKLDGWRIEPGELKRTYRLVAAPKSEALTD